MMPDIKDTPIYTALAIKHGWITTKHHRWYRLLDVLNWNH